MVLRELTHKDTLLLVNRVDLVSEVEFGGCLGQSDDKMIEFKVSVDRKKSVSKASTLDIRLQDEDGHLTKRDRENIELFNASFSSVFDIDDEPRESQCPELEYHDCKNELQVDTEIV
ncbi:hypothetical protein WISP_109169 [Willisornis vidua]|uniref:Uncharacterized protein n=1 Tax=Willisornis vidua TaxID=1566151 RepID=A0ABQ9CZ04_9PASS|nr:hypothetical protein WISP_109169 [Willisornis vidua]